jgi:hypothetical protein
VKPDAAAFQANSRYEPMPIHQQEDYRWAKAARLAGPIPDSERNARLLDRADLPEIAAEEMDYVIAQTLEWDPRSEA